MDWSRILYMIGATGCLILMFSESRLLKKTRGLNDEVGVLLRRLHEMPDVVPCYECKYYEEGVPFCPKSGMKMKDGLIFCCYGERKEASYEGEN